MEILRSLLRNRNLIAEMVRRDVQSRYLGSAIGLFWSIINPLVTLAIYTIIFSSVLQVRLGGDDASVYTFVQYLFAGLLPWITFQESISRSATCILENVNLVQKMRFPTEILPVDLVLSGFIHQLIGTLIFLVVLALTGDLYLRWLFLLPVVFAIQLIGTIGLGWLVATMNVYYRDVVQVLGVVLTVWFWATPIVYDKEKVEGGFRVLLEINPVTHLVNIYRDIVLRGSPSSWTSWIFLSTASILIFILGFRVMGRCKKEFADLI